MLSYAQVGDQLADLAGLANLDERLLQLELREDVDAKQAAGVAELLSRVEALEVQLRREPEPQHSSYSRQLEIQDYGLSAREAESARFKDLQDAFDVD